MSFCSGDTSCSTGFKYGCRTDTDCGAANSCIAQEIMLGSIDHPVVVYGICSNK
jgi:hypothetical protein